MSDSDIEFAEGSQTVVTFDLTQFEEEMKRKEVSNTSSREINSLSDDSLPPAQAKGRKRISHQQQERNSNSNKRRKAFVTDVVDSVNMVGLMENAWNKININQLVKNEKNRVYFIERVIKGEWNSIKVTIDGERIIYLPRRMVENLDDKKISALNKYIQVDGNDLFIVWRGEKILPHLNVVTNLLEFVM